MDHSKHTSPVPECADCHRSAYEPAWKSFLKRDTPAHIPEEEILAAVVFDECDD